VPEHVRVHPWQFDTCLFGEASQSPGGAVSVHSRAARGWTRASIPQIPTTGVFQARRVWTLLDQLLTAPTLLDAEQSSRELTATVD
jgi:hypothetical protein